MTGTSRSENRPIRRMPPNTTNAVMIAMVIALVWLGLYPQPVLDLAAPVLERLQSVAAEAHFNQSLAGDLVP